MKKSDAYRRYTILVSALRISEADRECAAVPEQGLTFILKKVAHFGASGQH